MTHRIKGAKNTAIKAKRKERKAGGNEEEVIIGKPTTRRNRQW